MPKHVTPKRIAIIGAGPTGLGAAWRLCQLGHDSWDLFEAADHPGGLASSVLDEHGFTWDLGGHVVFSRYEYFNRLLDQLLTDGWLEHRREAWVWLRDRFIPYPLQNNLWRLPKDDRVRCLRGLISAHRDHGHSHASDFGQWIRQQFGEGLAEIFMEPYNFKVWAYPPSDLSANWIGQRVARVDLDRVLTNIRRRQDDVSWGPNARFRFPKRHGTGAIWWALYHRLPAHRIHFGKHVWRLNSRRRVLHFDDGSEHPFDLLLSTMPLDRLIASIDDQPQLGHLVKQFKHSSTHVVGVGVDGVTPDRLAKKSWMYFPEPNCPFYRVTVFSNYSPHHVARPGHQWSLLAETSQSPQKPLRSDRIVNDTLRGLQATGLLSARAVIATTWHRRLEYGYPTPFLGRDRVLRQTMSTLEAMGILSRGRFGAWKYEVSNQDHSLMQGVEAVNRGLLGHEEFTFRIGDGPPERIGRKPIAMKPCVETGHGRSRLL